MTLEQNQYYRIAEKGTEAVAISKRLLQSYPLTRACMQILGQKLIDRLEFAVCAEGFDFIVQDEAGKDLFLLCLDKVDVLVNGTTVVQMEAPALLGDKGIVEPESKRAATIRVAPGQTCLLLKIPMGLFLRNFNDKKIQDKDFAQETGIFCYMFEAIQKRLFEFIYLQKNLWEEVNTTLVHLNSQLIAKILDNKKDMGWPPKVWSEVKNHLQREHGYIWPENMPLNVLTFRDIFYKLLEKRFPRGAFKGTDRDYLIRRHLYWRSWLTQVGVALSKSLPKDKLPVSIGEVELFNPRNYQMRLQSMLKAVEKKFASELPTKGENGEKEGNAGHEIGKFFGKGENQNQFDLKKYLDSFHRNFSLKHPRRIQAQVAQRSALVAAKCENQFNSSIARMQAFIDKAHQVAGNMDQSRAQKAVDPKEMDKHLQVLLKGFPSFNRKVEGGSARPVGEVCYIPGLIPRITELIKASGSNQIRVGLEKAFGSIVENLNLAEGLPMKTFKDKIYLGEASPGFVVSAKELYTNHWIPISKNITLRRGEESLGYLEPGMIVGGKGWMPEEESIHTELKLTMPERQETDRIDLSFLVLIIPKREMAWELKKSTLPEYADQHYKNMMQWLVDRHLVHIHHLLTERNKSYEDWIKLERTLKLEKKVKSFESSSTPISSVQFSNISTLLKDMLGLNLVGDSSRATNQLSKKIYNFILQQMKKDHPTLSVEERGNKTYTKWRFVLSEIIQSIDRLSQKKGQEEEHAPKPILEMIFNELNTRFQDAEFPEGSDCLNLEGEELKISIPKLFKSLWDKNIDLIMIFRSILNSLESHLLQLIEENRDYKIKLDMISSKRPQVDVEELQTEVILESSEKLMKILKEEFSN